MESAIKRLGLRNVVRVLVKPYYFFLGNAQKEYAPTNEVLKPTSLRAKRKGVTCIEYVEHLELLAFAHEDSKIRVYGTSGSLAEHITMFSGHRDKVKSVIHLEEQIMASVGIDMKLFTWNISSGIKIDEMSFQKQNGGEELFSINILDKERLVIGAYNNDYRKIGPGRIIIVKHLKGSNICVLKRIDSYNLWITTLASDENYIVSASGGIGPNRYTASREKYATVWDKETYNYVAELFYEGFSFSSVSISNGQVIVGANGGLRIYDSSSNFELKGIITSGRVYTKTVLLGEDLLLASTRSGFIDLISIEERKPIARVLAANGRRVTDFALIGFTRVAIGTSGGLSSIIELPPKFSDKIKSHLNNI